LRAAGYDVLSATDGLTATRAAIHERPDAIVLDIGLPAGDGHVIARRLLDHPRTSGIPIIFLTARTTRDDVVLAQQHGAFAYLVKPYEPAELLAMVQHATSGRHRFEDIDMGPAA
ncbi:MAG: response regulator transcription factor, partial [Vicinamibacterales bacterium]